MLVVVGAKIVLPVVLTVATATVVQNTWGMLGGSHVLLQALPVYKRLFAVSTLVQLDVLPILWLVPAFLVLVLHPSVVTAKQHTYEKKML